MLEKLLHPDPEEVSHSAAWRHLQFDMAQLERWEIEGAAKSKPVNGKAEELADRRRVQQAWVLDDTAGNQTTGLTRYEIEARELGYKASAASALHSSAEQAPEPAVQPTLTVDVSKGLKTPEQPPERASQSWQDIEIIFLSDERVEIRSAGDRQTYNYGELGFQDRRNGKPNRAWIMLREMALHGGTIPQPAPLEGRAKFEKRVQELRKKLRGHFGIQSDPIPLTGHDYRTSFTISCGASFET